MTDIDLAELKRLASEATPGPWEARYSGVVKMLENPEPHRAGLSVAVVYGATCTGCDMDVERISEPDAAFVAAANPAVVAALVDRVERAERIVAAVRDVAEQDAASRRACAESEDCSCAYKDCYECGKWHNCKHTPLTPIRAALDQEASA